MANIEKGEFSREHKSISYDAGKTASEEISNKVIGMIKKITIFQRSRRLRR
ncbi:MAG: hypothetical protein L6V93_16475 [Clostridiales bacterium]|nr:MAG: hypothetical protein L6V93_16475 [Clostridiales bacterium]